jgi:hypothetical protein
MATRLDSFGHGADHEPLDVGRTVPVVVIALEHDVVVGNEGDEAVRTDAASGRRRLRHRCLGVERRVEQVHDVQARERGGVRLLGRDVERVLVDDVDADQADAQRELVVRTLRKEVFVQHAVERELDRLGVDRRAALELDALPDAEAPGAVVVQPLPGLEDPSQERSRLVVPDRAVEYLPQDVPLHG